MKKSLLCSLLMLSSFCSAGPVGMITEHYIDADRQRQLDATLLFPADSEEAPQLYADNPAFYGYAAIAGAPVAGEHLPVYILVHGTSGNRKNLSWLGSMLAERGALVVMADFPGYSTGQATPESVLRMWEQPRDVSFLIDQLETGQYASLMDSSHITVIGYSLGGYTALALAGARLDISGYQQYCEQHQDASCRYFSAAFAGLTEQDRALAAADYRDKRVKKVLALAPGYVPAVVPESLKHLSAETVIVGAQYDENVPPEQQLKPYLLGGSVSYQEISGATHFSFMQNCKPGAQKLLAEENAAFVCAQLAGSDRRSIHWQLLDIVKRLGLN